MKEVLNKKVILAWCFFDWASAAFPIIVTTFIFSTYFTAHIAVNEITGTYQWANATALAGIIIAICSPIFGAIADYSGHIKIWLWSFTFLCILSSALLWFAYPNENYIFYTLMCVVYGTIGLEISLVFYNSFLPHIVPKSYIGRVSGWGWGMGYIGGILLLSIALFGFVKETPSWLNANTAAQVRICGPLVAIWFLLFSLPLFFYVPDMPNTGFKLPQAIKHGIRELIATCKILPQQKNILLYLIAHLIYIDGLNTLFAFGGIYAAGTFKMSLPDVLLFGLSMNIGAGIGAIILAWVDDYCGSKPTIIVSLVFLTLLAIPMLILRNIVWFWVFGLLLSLFVGPVQAASRSLMTRLTPANKSTEMFGLYAFSGRITSFIGPWLLGMMTLHFQSQRAGMSTVLLFFIVGICLMFFVQEKKADIPQSFAQIQE